MCDFFEVSYLLYGMHVLYQPSEHCGINYRKVPRPISDFTRQGLQCIQTIEIDTLGVWRQEASIEISVKSEELHLYIVF